MESRSTVTYPKLPHMQHFGKKRWNGERMDDHSAVGRGWTKSDTLITAVQQLVPNELASNTFPTNHLQHTPTEVAQNSKVFFRN